MKEWKRSGNHDPIRSPGNRWQGKRGAEQEERRGMATAGEIRMRPEMQLPKGKTCNDCYHTRKCQLMFGCKPTNTECDFYPIRFYPIPKKQQEQRD